MIKKDIIKALENYPDDMPVNVHIEYKSGVVLRLPGVVINYVDPEGTIHDEPVAEVKEISLFVVEAMLGIKRKMTM